MLIPRAKPVASVLRDLKTILTPEDEKGRGPPCRSTLRKELNTERKLAPNIQEVGTQRQALAW